MIMNLNDIKTKYCMNAVRNKLSTMGIKAK